MKHYKQEIIENEGTWLEVDEIHSIKLYSNNGIRFIVSLLHEAFSLAWLIYSYRMKNWKSFTINCSSVL